MRNLFKGILLFSGCVIIYKLQQVFANPDLILADPASAIAGGLALGKGLFGTKSSQAQTQRSFTQFRPEDLARIEQARGGLETGTSGLLSQLEKSRQALQTGMLTPSTGFQFAQTPDAYTRAMASFMGQGAMQQAAAQRQDVARRLPGAVGQVLGRQIDMQTRLAQNPNIFQALQNQQSRELEQRRQQQAEIEATNRALLGREQAVSSLAGTGLSAQQQLLSNLLGVGQAFGENVQTGQMQGRSGGMLK